MATLKSVDVDLVTKAVIAWTGYEAESFPSRRESDVELVVSEPEFPKILHVVKMLEDEFYESDAHFTAESISGLKQQSKEEFIKAHPELPLVIADAFAWCYSYDYK